MNDTIDPFDSDNFGWYSPPWMAKAALAYVPRAQLYHAVVKMIDFMVYTEEWEVGEAIDRLVQYALTGTFHETHDPMHFHVHFEPNPESADEPVQADIDKAFNEIWGEASSKMGPDAEDPHENFRLDDDQS